MESQSNQTPSLSEESASLQAHFQILQGIIQRMASNSTSCKAWCITIVSAILVLIADKGKSNLVLLVFLPTFLFLALEKAFRSSYNSFVKKLHSNELQVNDLFSVIPRGDMTNHQVEALKSFSVWASMELSQFWSWSLNRWC